MAFCLSAQGMNICLQTVNNVAHVISNGDYVKIWVKLVISISVFVYIHIFCFFTVTTCCWVIQTKQHESYL